MMKTRLSIITIGFLVLTISVAQDTKKSARLNTNPAKTSQEIILTGDPTALESLVKKLPLFEFHDTYNGQEKKILKKIGSHQLIHSKTLKLNKPTDLDQIRAKIRSTRLRVQIEENSIVTVERIKRSAPIHKAPDPFSVEQWGIHNVGKGVRDYIDASTSILVPGVVGEDIHFPKESKEGLGVTVAVLDTGADFNHVDLSASILTKKEECENLEKYKSCVKEKTAKECDKTFQLLDADQNGYPMDCRGWSMLGKKNPISGLAGTQETMDSISHGSHVAGIISAQAENGIGIRGVAPKAKILPVQVINENPGEGGVGGGNNEDKATSVLTAVARGLIYAIASKAQVVNLSLGWNGRADSETIRELVSKAEAAGMIIVSAAGNDGTDALVFPCQYSNVICVGAHGPDGKLSRFSNFGSGVDIAAPGLFILSTIPSDQIGDFFTDIVGYDFKDGTSMATPYVTGAVAVLLSDGIPATEIKARLLAGARKRPLVENQSTLSGNLDIENALKAKPVPYIVPIEKGVHATLWEKNANKIPVQIDLKNIWGESKNVQIKTRLSSRDEASENLSLEQSKFILAAWKPQETRSLHFNIVTEGNEITSDITLYLDVNPEGGSPSTIRVMILASSLLSQVSEQTTTKKISIVSGEMIPESSGILSFSSQDGRKERDYLVYKESSLENWQLQILRETPNGYIAGPVREIPAFENPTSIRSPLTLDVNLDGKTDYIMPVISIISSENENGEMSRIPTFKFFYLGPDGQDILPAYEFKNEKTTIMQFERYQWIKKSGRLVQAWLDYGNTPDVERSKKFDPWNPKPIDEKKTRIYYHDPETKDGVRSFSPPKGFSLGDMIPVDSAFRRQGKALVILTKGETFVNDSFVAELDGNGFGIPVSVHQDDYRNLVPLENIPVTWLNQSDATGIGYIGHVGLQSQRSTILGRDLSNRFSTIDITVDPFEKFETLYRVMGLFSDSKDPSFVSTYAQSDYLLYYSDSKLENPLTSSLRRYNFLGSFLFDRSFYTAVVEMNGKRIGALQIPDLMGAYPGSEVIAPRIDVKTGQAVDLIRPAALRFLNDTENCEWMNRIDPTENEPSQAVYFCGDHFLRIPYRL